MKLLIIKPNDEIAITSIQNATSPIVSPIINTANVTWIGGPDGGLPASASITILPTATISITKTASPSVVISGIRSQVIFTIIVNNTSTTTPANNVVIADTLPNGFTVTGVTSTSGVVAWTSPNSNLTVTNATLAANSVVTVTVTTTFIG